MQPKLNGVRALFQAGYFQSRDEVPFEPAVLGHIAQQLAELPVDVILDGELYVHGWPLQRINAAVTPVRKTAAEASKHVEFHVFDMVELNTPFDKRQQKLRELVKPSMHVKLVDTVKVSSKQEGDRLYSHWLTQGYEGAMYRLGHCPYTLPKQPNPTGRGFLSDKNNRVWHMLKRKGWLDEDYPCVSIEEGSGKRAGKVGALILTTPEGRLFRVGSFAGFSEQELADMLSNPPIGRKVKVRFISLSEQLIPQNPTAVAIL